MEKEFIPYSEALALKELGFDEPCIRGWDKNGKIWYHPDSDIVLDNLTFSQAFRWLLVLLNKNKYFSNKWTISYNEDYSSLFLGGCNMGVFKTETECLKKLIEIIRNGK